MLSVLAALAALVVVIHGILILCVVFGSVAAIGGRLHRRPGVAGMFYSILGLVVASDLLLGECALTRWERALRESARPGSGYSDSFIGHYFGFLPPFVHHWIGPALVVSALAAYPFWRWFERQQSQT